MADENQEKQLIIQKIYIKDVSLETPNSPQIFNQQGEFKVEINLGNSAQSLNNGLFEVILTVTVTVKLEDKTAYLAEVAQAGVFTLAGFDENELGQLIGSYTLNLLFPFAREAVSDLVVKAGFPPMLLPPVNFDARYMQLLQQQQQAAAPASNTLN
jgi:preprotein translocase subunit SecB